MSLDQPLLIVKLSPCEQRDSQLLNGLERPHPQHCSFNVRIARSTQPLPSGDRTRVGLDAKKANFALKVRADLLRAVVVTQLQASRDVCADPAEHPAYRLAHRLQGRPTRCTGGVNSQDLRDGWTSRRKSRIGRSPKPPPSQSLKLRKNGVNGVPRARLDPVRPEPPAVASSDWVRGMVIARSALAFHLLTLKAANKTKTFGGVIVWFSLSMFSTQPYLASVAAQAILFARLLSERILAVGSAVAGRPGTRPTQCRLRAASSCQ